jgi:hypothetical protein
VVLSLRLEIVDFVGEKDAVAADPMLLLEELESVGDFRPKLERLGALIKLARAEGRPIKELLTNYMFIGPPGTGETSPCEIAPVSCCSPPRCSSRR